MTSFVQVPYEDILSFLRAYNQPISNDKIQNYRAAWSFLTKNNVSEVPIPIVDFLIALNLSQNNIEIPVYKTRDILVPTEEIDKIKLSELPTLLNLPSLDKERIIRVLNYLGALDNDMSIYDVLPIEVSRMIALQLNCKEIRLFCRLSDKFNNYCFNEGGLKSILIEKLKDERRDLSDYNLAQLERLCKSGKSKHISCGNRHVLVLNNSGQVYSAGFNEDGQLGLGDKSIEEPVLILYQVLIILFKYQQEDVIH